MQYLHCNESYLQTKEHTEQDLKNCITLASNIKPCNTLSAAYTFELCLLSPYIVDVIKTHLETENTIGNSLLDLVTLLTKELTSQFNICQESVYEAAKSVSMYGILFSIRHLMHKADMS